MRFVETINNKKFTLISIFLFLYVVLNLFDGERGLISYFEKQNKIRQYSDDLINKALELEGTITGEHGIGLQKKHYLLKEHLDNVPVMKAIKNSLDANNIMNPGKVFDLN